MFNASGRGGRVRLDDVTAGSSNRNSRQLRSAGEVLDRSIDRSIQAKRQSSGGGGGGGGGGTATQAKVVQQMEQRLNGLEDTLRQTTDDIGDMRAMLVLLKQAIASGDDGEQGAGTGEKPEWLRGPMPGQR
jgi:hypothetical protein